MEKSIKTDLQTYETISRIAKACGKSRKQLLREVFSEMSKACNGKHVNLKTIVSPILDSVHFMFYSSETFACPKISKKKVKKHE